jgi:predicted metalloprotease with PDZ domain
MLAFIFAITALFGLGYQPTKYAISYRIKPVPLADRTNLEVSVRFKPDNANPIEVRLPTDYYNTPDLYRYVKSFEGEAGSIVNPGKDEKERLVQPNKDGEVRLRYVISYDPKVLDEFAFAPNVGPGHFHTAGCQWLLQIGAASDQHEFWVEIVEEPKGWQLYSSIDPNPRRFHVNASYEDLIPTAIGGAVHGYDQFAVHSRPVDVFVDGTFNIPTDEIQSAVRRIVTLQREWFSDFGQPFYHVVIAQRSSTIAGTAIDNLFVCFAKADITREQLLVLLSHEMFHTWMPNRMDVKLAEGDDFPRFEWYGEGFVEYFARKLLVDAGLLAADKFAELINGDIFNLADNPNHAATYADLMAAVKASKYGTAFKKLSYYRGTLIALKWEAQLRSSRNNHQLGDLILEIYRLAANNGGHITEKAFFDLAASYGLDAKGDFERYIIRGETLSLAGNSLGDRYELRERVTPSFDPGFSIAESFRQRKVVGVIGGGNAYRAGLREGMDVVRMQNFNRFGNTWNVDQPLVVIVRVNGIERPFEFFPRGAPLKLRLYEPRR